MKKTDVDIHERIFRWVISCLKIISRLPNDSLARVIKYQFAKAVTSVGANDQEANNSASRQDFAAKYGIVKKELAESLYWLRIISNQYLGINVDDQIKEGNELLNIVSSIILSSKRSPS